MPDEPVVPAAGGQGDPAVAAAAAAVVEPPKPWYAELEDPELRGYSETKGWKTPKDLAESYRNLEKLAGVPKERLLKLPEKLDDVEAMKPILSKLGLSAPDKADDYGLTTLEGADLEFAKVAQGWMHESGLSKAQALKLAGLQMAWEKQQKGQLDEAAAQELGAFDAKHGANAEAKKEAARRAITNFGVDEDGMKAVEAALGPARFFDLFSGIGERIGEAKFIDGDSKPKSFSMSPEAAMARKTELMTSTDWVKKYTGGDAGAANEMARLNRIIANSNNGPSV